ncbi:hypothetical protein PsorP6_008838 [Peronosclerospora sorghi]|uniref:Uncharacterized protein n=1 Tax=Peronosclerospora sorghi TaxID=230839 RepID=A0ACC0VXH3_9STRA|nr:hypothetical protein PsorP6_008838 [Peronosclerospora sorghi]
MASLKAENYSMDDERTVLMDKTAVYFEDPRMVTVDTKGAKHLTFHSTELESMRITATNSGRKITLQS